MMHKGPARDVEWIFFNQSNCKIVIEPWDKDATLLSLALNNAEVIMSFLTGLVIIVVATLAAGWINDHTTLGGRMEDQQ